MKNRLPEGGRIDRQKPLSFHFNGQRMTGYAGDTIASALLANNVRIVARSYKYHRPRGLYSAGPEEPHAIFNVVEGERQTPNVRATLTPLRDGMDIRSQGGWPSVNHDIGAILSIFSRLLPAGFYYKTFMRPTKLWMFYEKIIRRAASSSPPPTVPDPDSYLHHHRHCDVLVVGGGVAGVRAAREAGEAGADVILADLSDALGGQLLDQSHHGLIDGDNADEWLRKQNERLRAMANVTVLTRTTIQGYHDYNYLVGMQELTDSAPLNDDKPRQRLFLIRAKQVIIAAGAIERPLIFAGNDMPGVMLSSAVHAYLHRYGVRAGRNILFFTNNDSVYPTALAAVAAGMRAEIADCRSNERGHWQKQAEIHKIPVRYNTGITCVGDNAGTLSVKLHPLQETVAHVTASHGYDIVAVSGGWTPTVHLFSQARGALKWSDKIAAFEPGEAHPLNPCQVVGAANGTMNLAQCLREGAAAGAEAATRCGLTVRKADGDNPAAKTDAPELGQQPYYPHIIPTVHPLGKGPGKHFVDLMNDVTAADIFLAEREGYQSVEHMKRYTAAGFGTDQGKTGNVNALTLLAKARGVPPSEVGHTTYRPQYTPMSYGVVAGKNRRALFAQERTTPIDPWHREHNAVYEDVGDWRRPRYFPQGDESMDDAVWRECKAARHDVAVMDAGTLGKIDIQGADAAEFLDMIYTNQFSTLGVGRCRYGLMLHETGMIFDDGVTARLADNHFHMTTSTGHAASVLTWMEEWLQTEWPNLRVFCTSVTEQWAVISIAGPKARQLLSELTDIPLAADDFPFMSFREGVVAGAPARVFRISFSGETAFEINVPAGSGLAVWKSIMKHGKAHGITPYGTEAMHVLRAEKGYIIVGQDSDGTMTPHDMNLTWMLSKKKADYLGRRSLARPDMQRDGRLQFVGLLPEDPQAVIAEGAHLFRGVPPAKPEGHVTSSYMSATLERSFALAMLEDGLKRRGETVYAVMMDDKHIKATVTDPVFWDKEGKRLHG